MDFVELLSTGVSGFAFLMLYVGYQLTSSVQKKILDVNLQETDADRLKVWNDLADKQLSNTRYFMFFSGVILIAGLIVLQLQYRPEANIGFSVSPSESAYMPVVYAQTTLVPLDQNGKGTATIKNEHIILVDNQTIFDALNKERKKAEALKVSEKALAEKLASFSSDSGFGGF